MGPIRRRRCPHRPRPPTNLNCVSAGTKRPICYAVKSVISFTGAITWLIYTEGSLLHKCSFSPSLFRKRRRKKKKKKSPSVVSCRGSNFGRKCNMSSRQPEHKLPALPLPPKSSGEILVRYQRRLLADGTSHKISRASTRARAPRGCGEASRCVQKRQVGPNAAVSNYASLS